MIFGMRLQKKLQNKWDLTGKKSELVAQRKNIVEMSSCSLSSA